MKAIKDFKQLYDEAGGLINLEDVKSFTNDLLLELKVNLQDLRQDCWAEEGYEANIEWVKCKDGDYLDYEKVEYRINQQIKELNNILNK